MRKSEDQLALAERLYLQRILTRAKHSMLATRELNDQLADIEAEHSKALMGGELRVLKPGWAALLDGEDADVSAD